MSPNDGAMDIFVDGTALRNFRRRAIRRYPLEYICSLWGVVNRNGSISILEFRDIEHEATTDSVTFDEEDGRFGDRDGRLVQLGTIHTHPDCPDCSPSEFDWHECKARRELITGVMSLARKGKRLTTRVRFFFARALCKTDVK